ncbi:histidine phosphatase family protein [Dactylosporangium sp. CA-152071]|uniref:histidine phosphatase family protein n=1 Tax=Dactylosporangium sp. CA-152071 TaxID=3239933 RepID=UPI003D8EFC88
MAARVPQGSALVVAHSTIIRLVVCAALGLPLAQYRRRLPALDPVAVTTLRLSEDGVPVALLAYNVPVSEGWQP